MCSQIDPKKVFVVIPTYNEHKSLPFVVDRLIGMHYHVVVVDDGSACTQLSLLKDRKIYFLRHRINLGQGAALQTGIEYALSRGASRVVTFDADGQHDANDVDTLLLALQQHNCDIVLGSRFLGKSNPVPLLRKTVLKSARFINYLFTGLFLTDAHNGLRAMTRETAELIHLKENRMAHATEILSVITRNHLNHREVPVNVYYSAYSRQKGQTTMNSFRIFFDLLLNKIFR